MFELGQKVIVTGRYMGAPLLPREGVFAGIANSSKGVFFNVDIGGQVNKFRPVNVKAAS